MEEMRERERERGFVFSYFIIYIIPLVGRERKREGGRERDNSVRTCSFRELSCRKMISR